MNNVNKESDNAGVFLSIVINALVLTLMYGALKMIRDWRAIGRSYDEAMMIVLVFGMLCFGFSVLFSYTIGSSARKKVKVTSIDISLIAIPSAAGVISYLFAYWGFHQIIFIFGLIIFPALIYSGYMTGKKQIDTTFSC